MKVLIEKSHQAGPYTGAPEEKNYIATICNMLDAAMQGTPVQLFWINGDLMPTDTDATILARHPELKTDYDAFISLHYDADVYRNDAGDHLSGQFWDRAEQSLTAERDDALGAIWQRRYGALTGVPEFHPERRNANTRNYWLFRSTTPKTPGIILELGVGAPGAPDHDWLRDNAPYIVGTIKLTLLELGSIVLPTVPVVPPKEPTSSPTGVKVLAPSTLRYLTLVDQLRAKNPGAPLEIAALYSSLAPVVGISAEVALAQAIHETDWFRFTGRAKSEWHNPCGLGVGANALPGVPISADCVFPTWEVGVRAHCGHLLMYFGGPDHVIGHIMGYCDKDPRHGGHRNLSNDLIQLDGKWAVPGDGYAAALIKLIPS